MYNNAVDISKNYRTVLYYINENSTIRFTEDDNQDIVDVIYEIENDAVAFYSEEFVSQKYKNSKKVDITAGIINHKEKTVYWNVYDVKHTLHGEDMILHLYDQWSDGCNAVKEDLLSQYIDYQEKGEVGVFTSAFDEEEVIRRIEKMKERIEILQGTKADDASQIVLGRYKSLAKVPHMRNIINALECLIKKTFSFYGSEEKREIPVKICRLELQADGSYMGRMEV